MNGIASDNWATIRVGTGLGTELVYALTTKGVFIALLDLFRHAVGSVLARVNVPSQNSFFAFFTNGDGLALSTAGQNQC
jgi:hypothetical protein